MHQPKDWKTQGQPAPDKNWPVEFHEDFYAEFRTWSEVVPDAVFSTLGKLRLFGPSLGRPGVDTLKG